MTHRISDFTPIAYGYDATRHIPDAVLERCFARLAGLGALPRRAAVLDIGCGTGQISTPLAGLGHGVVGLDVSEAMVRIAAGKRRPGWSAHHVVGDGRALPFPDAAFDLAVFSKLLLHVEDWRSVCREAVRVARPGGAVAQVSERGFFGNAVRRAFARRADELGHTGRLLGPPSASAAISDYMAELGCAVSKLEAEDLRWEHAVTPRDALEAFRQRLFAEFWSIPARAYDGILAEVAAWAAGRPGGLDEPERLRPFLSVDVYRVPPWHAPGELPAPRVASAPLGW